MSTLPLHDRMFCRPQHSLLPLASLLEAELNRDYYEGQEKEFVQKVIAPQYWPFDRFDLVLVFDRRGDTWTYTGHQLLLAGDRPEVID